MLESSNSQKYAVVKLIYRSKNTTSPEPAAVRLQQPASDAAMQLAVKVGPLGPHLQATVPLQSFHLQELIQLNICLFCL